MITYTVHSALYLLQTKISRLLIANDYRIQNISCKVFVNLHYWMKNIERFILKANSCMFLSFVTIMKGLYIMVHA